MIVSNRTWAFKSFKPFNRSAPFKTFPGGCKSKNPLNFNLWTGKKL